MSTPIPSNTEQLQKRICGNCRNFAGDDLFPKDEGECRFNPPQLGLFMNVYPDNWCGKWQDKSDNSKNELYHLMNKVQELETRVREIERPQFEVSEFIG